MTPQSTYAKVAEMVANICAATGVRPPDKIEVLSNKHWSYVAACAYQNGKTGILIGNNFFEFFPDDEAYAVLAHEIGHMAAGHVLGDVYQPYLAAQEQDPNFGQCRVAWEYEFIADDFVKKAGMAKPFIRALFRISKEIQGVAFDSADHPGVVRRVKRLI